MNSNRSTSNATSKINRQRLLAAASGSVGFLALTAPLGATQITWSGASDGSGVANWQNLSNWGGALPVNSANTALFTDSGTYNSTSAATIDANGTFSIGEIQFTTTTSGTAPPITINNSQNGIITLTGATGVLVQNKQTNPVTLNTNLALANAATGNVTTFNTTQATTVNGVISGGGNLLKTGSAILALKGVNTYTGTTTVQQNNLQIGADAPSGSAGALGNSTTAVQLGNSTTTAIQNFGLITTGHFTVGRDISVFPVPLTTGVVTLGGTQAVASTFSGQVTLGDSANFESSTTLARAVDFSGPITGAGGVTKTNAGTVQFDNLANNYLGATTVLAGTLLINGLNTGGGAYSVKAGALGGVGSIATGAGVSGVSVANGSTIAPGLLPGGTATSGSVFTVTGDATLDGALSIQADTNTSRLATSGSLILNADSSLVFTGTSLLTAPAYVIARYGSLGGTGAFGSISNEPAGYSLDYTYNGNEIALVAGATPEPASVALLGLGSLGLLKRRGRN